MDGELYPSVENAYQASKTVLPEERLPFKACSFKEAKEWGSKLVLREDWNEFKLVIMKNLLKQKFSNPHLKQKLLETDPSILIEGNDWNDRFWGICNGVGENHLGKLLMEIRSY